MRITCIGGGPAGLYFALLMKQQDPANEVTLIERNAPSDVSVELPIGSRHADVTRVDVSFEESDELVHHVSLRFPDGAPESVLHTVELAPGTYTVDVDLTIRGDGTESRSGRVEAPAEGIVRVDLEEGS